MTPAEELAVILSEGLDLCVRGRTMDEQVMRAVEAGMGRLFPGSTRCGTPAIWVQEQYDSDLKEWEAKARAAMARLGFAR
jgi:hypothetical protein